MISEEWTLDGIYCFLPAFVTILQTRTPSSSREHDWIGGQTAKQRPNAYRDVLEPLS